MILLINVVKLESLIARKLASAKMNQCSCIFVFSSSFFIFFLQFSFFVFSFCNFSCSIFWGIFIVYILVEGRKKLLEVVKIVKLLFLNVEKSPRFFSCFFNLQTWNFYFIFDIEYINSYNFYLFWLKRIVWRCSNYNFKNF